MQWSVACKLRPDLHHPRLSAGAHSYGSKQAFDDARDRHRIAVGSKHDWDGSGSVYGWRVGDVRALREPVPVGSTGQVCFAERSFSVCFATTDSQHDLLTPPTAWRKPSRPVEPKAKVDTSAAVDAGDEVENITEVILGKASADCDADDEAAVVGALFCGA